MNILESEAKNMHEKVSGLIQRFEKVKLIRVVNFFQII